MVARSALGIGLFLALALVFPGCEGGGGADGGDGAAAADSAAAIAKSKELKTPKEQAEYLLAEAKRFITEDAPAEGAKLAENVMANFTDYADQAKKTGSK